MAPLARVLVAPDLPPGAELGLRRAHGAALLWQERGRHVVDLSAPGLWRIEGQLPGRLPLEPVEVHVDVGQVREVDVRVFRP